MKIKKILNNNVVISENEYSEEVIVMGRGIAFQKQIGDLLLEESIDKVFVSDSTKETLEIEKLITQAGPDIIEIAKEIILLAEERIGHEYSEKAYLSLTDHLFYATERMKEGISIPNPLIVEIKKFYSQEYAIGVTGCQMVRDRLNIDFQDDEAGFIALHLANHIANTENMTLTIESTEIMRDILRIISRYFGIVFDEDSLSYQRMMTHIQYFAQRILKDEIQEEPDEFLYALIQGKYPAAFNCSLKIREYLETSKSITVQDAEVIYLVIHIHRVIEQHKKENKEF